MMSDLRLENTLAIDRLELGESDNEIEIRERFGSALGNQIDVQEWVFLIE